MSETAPVTTQEVTEVPAPPPPPAPIWIDRFFKDEFKKESVIEFIKGIRELKRYPIVIYLNSNGGNVIDGKIMADYLGSLGVPVTFVHELHGYSMGLAISQSKDHDFLRLAYHHTHLMVHGYQYRMVGSDIEIANQTDYLKEIQNYWETSYIETVGLTKKEFSKLTSYDNFFYGHKALHYGEHGFIDGVILKDNADGTFLIQTRDGKKIIDVTKHRRSDLKNIPVIAEEKNEE